jgi:hypothetical protein
VPSLIQSTAAHISLEVLNEGEVAHKTECFEEYGSRKKHNGSIKEFITILARNSIQKFVLIVNRSNLLIHLN